MEFYSILFDKDQNEELTPDMPEFFKDLNLDQIIDEILQDEEEYNLGPFFYNSLKDISAINYRLEVMKELENEDLFKSLMTFSREMIKVREYAGYSQTVRNNYQRKKWHLDAVTLYCDSVWNLQQVLVSADLKSEGFRAFGFWLTEYVKSESFIRLFKDTKELHSEFDDIKYCIRLYKDYIVVESDNYTEDYCSEIYSTFEKINDITFDYQINFFSDLDMCLLESKIFNIIYKMNKKPFKKLDKYCEKHVEYIDETVTRFDREIRFYLSYLGYINKMRRKGLSFAYPEVTRSKRINIADGYDLALAHKLQGNCKSIVANDLYLSENERISILTGPNQGGKTTFARAFGQIMYLASIGCPVPCRSAELFPIDSIFTHFSIEEDLSTNAGRLKEELFRLKKILGKVTGNSVIIINELFATTTSHDAYEMGKKILDYFIGIDCICLYVTHIFELTHISNKVVSLIAAVDSDKKAERTYKIVRKQADGYAYSNSIVEKYKLSYGQIKERIAK